MLNLIISKEAVEVRAGGQSKVSAAISMPMLCKRPPSDGYAQNIMIRIAQLDQPYPT